MSEMFDPVQDKMIPHIERLERQVKELQTRFNQPPKICIEIEANDTDYLIMQLQKIYQNFAAGCNLSIQVKLNDKVDTEGTAG